MTTLVLVLDWVRDDFLSEVTFELSLKELKAFTRSLRGLGNSKCKGTVARAHFSLGNLEAKVRGKCMVCQSRRAGIGLGLPRDSPGSALCSRGNQGLPGRGTSVVGPTNGRRGLRRGGEEGSYG